MHFRFLSASAMAALLILVATTCHAPQSAAPAQKPPITSETLVQSTRSWDGALLPAYPEGQPQVTILRITIAPGAKLPPHHHPVINAGVLLRGELTVITEDGRTLELKAGDPIVEVVETVHYGMNPGSKPAEIIVFYAGVVNTPVTVLEP